MDDLLKRQNQAGAGDFEADGLQGGDLSGGDGLQSKGLENDVGSGLELERGLERVAAQEAWLNEQASLPVENWLQNHGGQQISLTDYASTDTSSSYGQRAANHSLVVVDSRSNQWGELSANLMMGPIY